MTRGKNYSILIALAALAVVALACGPFSATGAAPTPTLFVLPGSDGGSGGDNSGDGGGILGNLDLGGLSSYRATFTMTWSGTDNSGNPTSGNATFGQEFNSNPPASRITWQQTGGAGAAMANFEIIQIGEVTYMLIPVPGQAEPACSTVTDAQSLPGDNTTMSPEDWTTGADMTRAQRILPDETVNGVLARHDRLTHTDLPDLSGFTNYTLDIWTALDGGYVVRQTMVADGSLAMMGQGNGHMEWTYDVIEVNVPVDIQAPPGCEVAGGGDFPTMPDAASVSSFGTILSYTTASPVADVVAFYNAQLPGLGWVAGTSQDVGGMATMEFTRGDEHISITITPASGTTTVLINFE